MVRHSTYRQLQKKHKGHTAAQLLIRPFRLLLINLHTVQDSLGLLMIVLILRAQTIREHEFVLISKTGVLDHSIIQFPGLKQRYYCRS